MTETKTSIATVQPFAEPPTPHVAEEHCAKEHTAEEHSADDHALVRTKRNPGDLDMTPMVDVTFLLLIFFMVTASFSLQKSIQMPRQSSEQASPSPTQPDPFELESIELHINDSGSFLVLARDWERESPGKQNLTTTLKKAAGENATRFKLDIHVHSDAKLQILVDAIDAATIIGFAKIQVTEFDGDSPNS